MPFPLGEEIASLLPKATVVLDRDVLGAHVTDRATFCPHGTPAALVRVSRREDIVAVMEFASSRRVPVVAQGARSGVAGGANAVDGAILLDLSPMNRILDIDPVELTAKVEPGVLNAELSRAVAREGLHYPPDPSSAEFSTIGGNIATNAGGLCCVKYGVTADYVRGLTVVLADGRVLDTGTATAKGVAGYDLTRLFTGSEGTLGVIAQATLSLRRQPPPSSTAVAFFTSLTSACTAARHLAVDANTPSMLEFLDRASVDIVRNHRDLGFPRDAEAMLLIQYDSHHTDPMAAAAEIVGEHGGETIVADTPAEAHTLQEARRSLGIATEHLGASLIEDVCVPRRALGDLVGGVAAIGRRHQVRTACAGHAGDGNMHPKIIFDAADPAEVSRARKAFDDVMRLGLELGGTITGEHGVGLLKRDWLRAEVGPVSMELHEGIKQLFDPHGILNPGKVL
ncbi:FAD-linked oxidase C-terminal domain-containing protein [Saccharomonospora sp. NPDC006951]